MSLKQVRAAMLQLQVRHNPHNGYRMGQLYNHVVDTKLAQKAKYRGALDYFHQHVRAVPRSTLVLYGVVARHFSETVCTRFGITCLGLLLTYEEAAGIQSDHDAPGGTLIQVPGGDGAVTRKRFGECSVGDMRGALQRLRKASSGRPVSTANLSHAGRHEQSVNAAPPRGSEVQVQASDQPAEVVIHFKNFPPAQVQKLAEALVGQLQPLRMKAQVS
jgi:hypothetical protein